MFCPRCAAPIEGTKFCRSCGANVSLVPQALSGNLPVQHPVNQEPEGFEYGRHGRRRRHRDHAPSLASGIQRTFMGIGFVLVALGALVFAPAGRLWWFWLLIPAFAMLGGGIAEIMRAKQEAPGMAAPPVQPVPSAPQYQPLPTAPGTNELPPRRDLPGSIVEGTTRHLDPTAGRNE
ncbi:MAG TPA: zinc ribbon domain-containing protein [Blastocatellia bacterium]|nr:zinc ribbon domain-containing protein [Blastocatellia bacterium]